MVPRSGQRAPNEHTQDRSLAGVTLWRLARQPGLPADRRAFPRALARATTVGALASNDDPEGAPDPSPGGGEPPVAVVVNYRCAESTVACVESLRSGSLPIEVVVVENGSGDASAEDLKRDLPQGSHLVVSAENEGFGAGCNRGIEEALRLHPGLSHVLLVNPDSVVAATCVESLVAEARAHPEAGLVGGRILDLEGDGVQFENGRFRPWTLGRSHVPAPRGARSFECTFVTGALMLLDGDLLREGLRFDPAYFLYVEDLDLCREVVRRGRTLRITLDAEIRHAGGGSQGGEDRTHAGMRPSQLRWITRNKVYFARKWLPLPQRLVFYLTAWLLKPVAGILRFGPRFLGAYYAALREGSRVGTATTPHHPR